MPIHRLDALLSMRHRRCGDAPAPWSADELKREELCSAQLHGHLEDWLACDRVTLQRDGKEKAARVIQRRLADHRLRNIGDTSQIMANGTFQGDLARVDSAALASFHVAPLLGSPSHVRLPEAAVLYWIRRKFEMGIFEDGATCEYIRAGSHTPCGHALTALSTHHHHCCRKQVGDRHNAMRNQLADLCREVGWTARIEQHVAIRASADAEPDAPAFKRADVLLTTPAGQDFAVDVRCVCVHGHAGMQLQTAENVKAREYGLGKSQRQLLGGIRFVPFCLSTAGAVGNEAMDFLQHLIRDRAQMRHQWQAEPWWRALQMAQRSVLSTLACRLATSEMKVLAAARRHPFVPRPLP